MHDFSGILKLAAAHKWSVVAIDPAVDTSTPTGKLVANVMMSVAQWEREVIGERTSVAMQAAKRQGRHMGRVSILLLTTSDRLLTLRATQFGAAGVDLDVADFVEVEQVEAGVTAHDAGELLASTASTSSLTRAAVVM